MLFFSYDVSGHFYNIGHAAEVCAGRKKKRLIHSFHCTFNSHVPKSISREKTVSKISKNLTFSIKSASKVCTCFFLLKKEKKTHNSHDISKKYIVI